MVPSSTEMEDVSVSLPSPDVPLAHNPCLNVAPSEAL